ncbi:MAG: sodium:calcium antiporter [Chloroflexi bacterium]|mgnify:CR=1 FL=1|nr:sodium:calcium antiporter [Chloroflexota bacterium]MBT7081717.1 sodium:calcium antiporter [Chloroflexota bacterium]MBT7289199.1 sodium:calcium antiporter [Chloroflexota bacterium]
MEVVWIKFIACAAIIIIAGTKLTRYSDTIADKTGLGKTFVGLVFLAVATSIPEMATSISAVRIVDSVDLALGDAFGSNLFNLLILALMDALYTRGSIWAHASNGQTLLAVFSMATVGLATFSVFMGKLGYDIGIGWLSIFSLFLVAFYMISLVTTYKYEKKQQTQPDLEIDLPYEGMTLKKAYRGYAISAAFIIGGGIWLAIIGKEITTLTGWDSGFVGIVFLGIATSLPELVVSITAIRIGSVDLAIGDILGSNIFNVSIIIFTSDIFYNGSAFSMATDHLEFIAVGLLTIVMTVAVLFGLVLKARTKTFKWISWNSIALVVLYIAGAYAIFSYL